MPEEKVTNTTPQNSDILFPHSNIRDGQKEFLDDVYKSVNEGKILLAHAPTGIGKTAAALGGMLDYALKNNKTIFFLTPKHTQHEIVIETLKKIKEKYNINFTAVDIIGKQWMCLYPDIDDISSSEFNEFCKAKKEHEECPFYKNAHPKKNEGLIADRIKNEVKNFIMHSEEVREMCSRQDVCPYEITIECAKDANIIICDYFHIFSKSVRDTFLTRIEKELSDSIIIIDESHNLPERIRTLLSHSISEFSIERAGKEAENVGKIYLHDAVLNLKKILTEFGKELNNNNEIFIEKSQFVAAVEKGISKIEGPANWKYDDFVNDVDYTGAEILKTPNRYRSYLNIIGKFLGSWNRDETGFVRILKKEMRKDATGRYRNYFSLYYNCLDPSVSTSEIFNTCHSAVLMSGTLIPLEMYKDILGIADKMAMLKEYKSPFPKENKLVIIVEGLTTKYEMRSEEMFKTYAAKIYEILKCVDDNVAIFFPSYKILDKISSFIRELLNNENFAKPLLVEQQDMTKEDRMELYKKLVKFKNSGGAVLCAVLAGSLSEGIDYANNLLSAVIVVGLPLDFPDLETKALINYYDEKFKAGWKYGYIYPAMNKVVQAAGRGIRSEKDRGVIVLLDERYKWQNFSKCLPKDFAQIVTEKPEIYIKRFFEKISQS